MSPDCASIFVTRVGVDLECDAFFSAFDERVFWLPNGNLAGIGNFLTRSCESNSSTEGSYLFFSGSQPKFSNSSWRFCSKYN